MHPRTPGAHGAREERFGEGNSGDAERESKTRVDEPEYAEHPDLAGIVFQFKLEAGNWKNRRRHLAAALRANQLPLGQSLSTSTAIHNRLLFLLLHGRTQMMGGGFQRDSS
jgi:hypothetical protein